MAHQPVSYTLPGRRENQFSYFKTSLARAFAASHATNPRNLEYYWYSAWIQIWQDLIHDLPSMYVGLQAPLWYRLPIDDAADDHDGPDVGNITLESIPATLAARSRREVIPDFIIIRILADWRDPLAGHIPKNMKIRYAGVPVLIENKRAPTRTDIYHQEDPRAIRLDIGRAVLDLMNDARVLFEMIPSQSSTVLVACSGPWWSSRVVTTQTFLDAEDQEVAEENLDEYFQQHADDDDDDDDIVDFSAGEADGPYMDEADLTRLGTSAEEYATDKIENFIEGWGSIYLLESRVSNLEFRRLHRHLVNVCNMEYGVAQG